MTKQEIESTLQQILIENFDIQAESFSWDTPLEQLDVNFKILGNLVFLEQLLEKEFSSDLPILENISAAIHSAEDICLLIIESYRAYKN